MTEGQQLAMDVVSGGIALLILRYLDHWFHRTKGKQAEEALLDVKKSDSPR